MPRAPVDGVKVKEIRVTLGSKERMLVEEISNSYRINSLKIPELLEFLDDPTKIIQVMYSIATIAEIIGLETGLPTVADIPEVLDWFSSRTSEPRAKNSVESLIEFFSNIAGGISDA